MAARTPEGPPPAPAVQKLRLRYARRDRMRFSSTRDFGRALERALRRAEIPMAYSAGFHPHPKISYANGAPTGMASEAEYFEISVTRELDPEQVRRELDEALPTGLDIVEVVSAGPGSLGDLLQASEWQLSFAEVPAETVERAITELRARESAVVTRMFKNGARELDVATAIERVEVVDEGGCAIMRMVVRHTTPAIRPDDVLTALREWVHFSPPTPARVTRLAQGPWDCATSRVADPLAADKSAAAESR